MNEKNEKIVYSYHSFVLPFIWEKPETDGSSELRRLFKAWQDRYMDDRNWQELYLFEEGELLLSEDMSREEFYREYRHFYPHMRETIYGCSETERTLFQDHFIVKCFALKPDGERISGTYTVEKGGKSYSLEVTGLELRIYNSGIGVYVLKCENRDAKYADPASIEIINDLCRCISKQSYENYACADRLTLDIKRLGTFTEEWTDSLDPLIKAGRTDSFSYICKTITGPLGIDSNDIRLGSNTRMMVISWADRGQIITSYAVAGLPDDADEEDGRSGFFRSICEQLAVLCIVQRASLMNFSRKAEQISRRIVSHGNNLTVRDKDRMINLNERYVAFLTQLDATELSSDQKTNEIYGMLRDMLKIDREKECIQEKLGGLSTLATAEQNFDFSSWAAAVAVAALVMSAGGLICESFSNKISPWVSGGAVVLPALTAALSIAVGLLLGLWLKRRK